MQKHNDAITTSGHSSLEKYTSHFIEMVVCERELATEQRLQHFDPPNSSGYHSLFFPFSLAAHLGAWGPSFCWDMVLIPASSLQLIRTSCRRGYIIIWRPPTSCERHNLHPVQPLDSQGHPLISSTGCTCYLHGCISSFDSLAWGNMQQESSGDDPLGIVKEV